jgi:hypothetical protein
MSGPDTAPKAAPHAPPYKSTFNKVVAAPAQSSDSAPAPIPENLSLHEKAVVLCEQNKMVGASHPLNISASTIGMVAHTHVTVLACATAAVTSGNQSGLSDEELVRLVDDNVNYKPSRVKGPSGP